MVISKLAENENQELKKNCIQTQSVETFAGWMPV